jgi:hypothetical protein
MNANVNITKTKQWLGLAGRFVGLCVIVLASWGILADYVDLGPAWEPWEVYLGALALSGLILGSCTVNFAIQPFLFGASGAVIVVGVLAAAEALTGIVVQSELLVAAMGTACFGGGMFSQLTFRRLICLDGLSLWSQVPAWVSLGCLFAIGAGTEFDRHFEGGSLWRTTDPAAVADTSDLGVIVMIGAILLLIATIIAAPHIYEMFREHSRRRMKRVVSRDFSLPGPR